MKDLLKGIVAFLGMAILSYLMWLFFHWIMPYMMSIQKVWLLIVLLIFVWPTILTMVITPMIAFPIGLIKRIVADFSGWGKFILLLPYLFNAYCTAALPWHLERDCTAQTIAAVVITIYLSILFIYSIFTFLGDD